MTRLRRLSLVALFLYLLGFGTFATLRVLAQRDAQIHEQQLFNRAQIQLQLLKLQAVAQACTPET